MEQNYVTVTLSIGLHRDGCPFSLLSTIRYDTRCYSNVRSKKADMSQLNLPHEPKGNKWKTEKNKK